MFSEQRLDAQDMADQFCLRWNNFQTNIVSALDSLKCSEDLVDVTLTCDGRNIKAHKVILSACSPYFRNVFKENPCQHPVIILKDVPADDIVNLLSYMYQGEVFIEESKLSSFLHTACLLQVKGLTGVTQKENFSSPNPVNKLYSQLTISPKSQIPQNKEIRTYGSKKRRNSASDKPSDVSFAENYKKVRPVEIAEIKNKADNTNFSPENNNETNEIMNEQHGLANGKNYMPQNNNNTETIPMVIKTEVMDEAESPVPIMTHSENDDSLPDYENSMLARSLLQGINPSKSDNSANSSAKKLSTMSEIHISKALQDADNSKIPIVGKSPHKNEDNIVKSEKKSPKPDPDYEPEILLSEHQEGSAELYSQDQSQALMLLAGMSSVSVQPGASTSQGVAHQSNHAAICGDCPHCGMKYSNQSALKYHVRLMHSDLTNRLCCYLCPRSFTMRETFKEHMWTSHGQRN